MSQPKITVVTPSYNQGHFLEETILSVLNQNYSNLEFFVIDGGSTDCSVDVILKYSSQITWWVSEKDKGQSDAINKGFRKGSGDILAWLNSDDVYCPGALQAVASFFSTHPKMGAVIGDQVVIDSKGRQIDFKKSAPVSFRAALYSTCAVPQPATFFTRDAWRLAGELDTSLQYVMDFEFFLRMMSAGIKFGTVRVPLAKFRLHTGSKTILEQADRVVAANRLIQDRFLGIKRRSPLVNLAMLIMAYIYRGQLYVYRAIFRGSFIPFRHSWAMRRITTDIS